jgi:hypothetical protein
MAGDPKLKCPNCASAYIERMPSAPPRDAGEQLSVDAAPAGKDPPNMRCNACGHTWWVPVSGRA